MSNIKIKVQFCWLFTSNWNVSCYPALKICTETMLKWLLGFSLIITNRNESENKTRPCILLIIPVSYDSQGWTSNPLNININVSRTSQIISPSKDDYYKHSLVLETGGGTWDLEVEITNTSNTGDWSCFLATGDALADATFTCHLHIKWTSWQHKNTPNPVKL